MIPPQTGAICRLRAVIGLSEFFLPFLPSVTLGVKGFETFSKSVVTTPGEDRGLLDLDHRRNSSVISRLRRLCQCAALCAGLTFFDPSLSSRSNPLASLSPLFQTPSCARCFNSQCVTSSLVSFSTVDIDVCGVLLYRVQIRAHHRLDTLSDEGVLSESLVGHSLVAEPAMNCGVIVVLRRMSAVVVLRKVIFLKM